MELEWKVVQLDAHPAGCDHPVGEGHGRRAALNLVMNVHRNFRNAMPYSPRYLQMMVDMLASNSAFCVSGIGPSQLEANVAALLLGPVNTTAIHRRSARS